MGLSDSAVVTVSFMISSICGRTSTPLPPLSINQPIKKLMICENDKTKRKRSYVRRKKIAH